MTRPIDLPCAAHGVLAGRPCVPPDLDACAERVRAAGAKVCSRCGRPARTREDFDALPDNTVLGYEACWDAAVPSGRDGSCFRLAAELQKRADRDLLAIARDLGPDVLREVHRQRTEKRRPVVYLAHPVGATTVEGISAHLRRARRWYWRLRAAAPWVVSCPWMCEVLACIEANVAEADGRDAGIANMCRLIDGCDAIVLVGGRVSTGMAIERDHAVKRGLRVIDLTDLGDEPPAHDALLEALAARMAGGAGGGVP